MESGDLMEVKQYLQRIHATLEEPTVQYLSTLQHLHMTQVPFENLDVIRNVPIYLNLERIYKKIIKNNRGGYCYEVNGLFHWLLKNIGFNVHFVAATVMRPNGEFAKKNTHVAIIATLDQPYLVDVGFGNSQLQPVTLDGRIYEDVSGIYKVEQVSEDFYDLKRKDNSTWRTLYRFTLQAREFVDFHEGVVFNQVSNHSTFTHTDLVTIATDTGRITLQDHTLTTTTNGNKTEVLLSPVEKERVLEDTFGIRLTNDS